jgi:predicted nucleic-acid-binding Zn-ribbon protein
MNIQQKRFVEVSCRGCQGNKLFLIVYFKESWDISSYPPSGI